ncbi:MAG: hypothetical protein AAF587_44485 [Bacteroidota bacterium]
MALWKTFLLRDSSNHLLTVNFWTAMSAADPIFLLRRLRSFNFFRSTSAAVNASRKSEPHLVQKYTFLKDFPLETAQVNLFSINFLAELPVAF